MIREAGPDDAAEVERRLSRQRDMAMFPLANLRSHGLAFGAFPSDHPRAIGVARAYAALGFQPNGSFALVLFAAPVTMPA